MPGLLGMICIQNKSAFDARKASEVLDRMKRVLYHRKDYSSDQCFIPEPGFYIIRLGHACNMQYSWDTDICKGTAYGSYQKVMDQQVETCPTYPALDRIERLEGFYSLAFIEKDKDQIVIATDKRAAEPIYYTENDGVLYFAPEVKALLAVCEISRKVNYAAMATFIGSGHLLNHQTLFDSIHKLPGGQALVIKDNKIRKYQYWRFCPGVNAGSEKDEELSNELGSLVSKAVSKNISDPDKNMIFLSGGADSRGILGGALELVNGKGSLLHTISWGLDRYQEGTDTAIAEMFADKYKLNHNFAERNSQHYEKWFTHANYLIDGMSDVVAFHPQEHLIIEQIRNDGFDHVIRGDEAFGLGWYAHDLTGFLLNIGLRRFSGIDGVSNFMHKEAYQKCVEAGDSEFDNLIESCYGMEPINAKDYLYFTHRLQTYNNSASYYKQVYIDHRNPLLDDTILEFLSRVPARLRVDRSLFRTAMAKRYADLWTYPFATVCGLENWRDIIVNNSSLRQYVTTQIADDTSGIWEYFNKQATQSISESVSTPSTVPPRYGSRKRAIQVRHMIEKLSLSDAQVFARRAQQWQIPNLNIIMRFIVLKNWHDTFVR